MTAKRIAAFLAAAALIVAALLIRNGLDDDDSGSNGPDATDAPRGGDVVVICSTEFEAICDQLDADDYDVTIEAAGKTLDDMSSAGANPPDAWITLDPFPAMVDDPRGRSGLPPIAHTDTVAATTPSIVALATGVSEDVRLACGETATWKCAGEQMGDELAGGGRLRPGITNPATQADGLVSFANAVSGYFVSSAFDSGRFQEPEFTQWMRRFADIIVTDGAQTPLDVLLVRSSRINVAATTVAETTGADQTKFEAVQLTPSIDHAAIVAMYGNRASGLAAELTPLLVAGGWAAPASSEPSLPAGTFIALRNLWEDYNK